MDVGLIVVVAVVGVIVMFAVWWFSAEQVARRAMRAVPRKAIRDVAEGEKARIVGSVELAQSIAAPLTGRACAYWRVVVQELRGGKNRRWVTVIDEHEGVDFFVRDESGKALIKTELVTPLLEKDAALSSGFLNDATPELEAFLAARGRSSKGWVFNKSMRYREGVVEHGETVCVVGVGRWERDPDERAGAGAGYREAEMPMRLVMSSPDDGNLLLSDEPGMTA